jgi:hypothetical protein
MRFVLNATAEADDLSVSPSLAVGHGADMKHHLLH